MTIVSNTVTYLDGDVALEAFFSFDDAIKERRPAVLINHNWVGRDEFFCEKARKIAALGYVGFAVDLYGNGQTGKNNAENAKLMNPFMEDRSLIVQRMNAALSAVKLLPWVDDSKCAAIGYCFGGTCVLDFARSGADLKGVVSFHGVLKPPSSNRDSAITAKVLVLHGHDDPMVPVEQVIAFEQEMTDRGVNWQVHSYGHTMHAYTNPEANDPGFGTVYQPDADRRSWQSMVNFLEEIFA
jgi:dienelactone hydrolase